MKKFMKVFLWLVMVFLLGKPVVRWLVTGYNAWDQSLHEDRQRFRELVYDSGQVPTDQDFRWLKNGSNKFTENCVHCEPTLYKNIESACLRNGHIEIVYRDDNGEKRQKLFEQAEPGDIEMLINATQGDWLLYYYVRTAFNYNGWHNDKEYYGIVLHTAHPLQTCQ